MRTHRPGLAEVGKLRHEDRWDGQLRMLARVGKRIESNRVRRCERDREEREKNIDRLGGVRPP